MSCLEWSGPVSSDRVRAYFSPGLGFPYLSLTAITETWHCEFSSLRNPKESSSSNSSCSSSSSSSGNGSGRSNNNTWYVIKEDVMLRHTPIYLLQSFLTILYLQASWVSGQGQRMKRNTTQHRISGNSSYITGSFCISLVLFLWLFVSIILNHHWHTQFSSLIFIQLQKIVLHLVCRRKTGICGGENGACNLLILFAHLHIGNQNQNSCLLKTLGNTVSQLFICLHVIQHKQM